MIHVFRLEFISIMTVLVSNVMGQQKFLVQFDTGLFFSPCFFLLLQFVWGLVRKVNNSYQKTTNLFLDQGFKYY